MANDARLEVRLPAELKARLPADGGERSRFVRRALEAALQRKVTEGEPGLSSGVLPIVVDQHFAPEDIEHVSGGKTVRPTAQQLAGKNKVPVATAARWLKSGEWRSFWP